MGDLRPWSPELNGTVAEEKPASLSSSAPPLTIGAANWRSGETATQLIITQVQPTLVSEERRRAVVDYVQRLIRNSIGCEVLPFGSVPLKTYLPDGDIDLTAFGGLNIEESLANDVRSILEMEDKNVAAEFIVKDVQLIRAEVKLVKCLVQNIVVDISFNQLGGLCTLCFLEEVDRLIGKDHLFKRSIILIKAWCYYESRILGAHHGLISTYALETLVLYIFHLFHSSLDGPLAVLYKFLDYFSKFDWDNYCISLNGPVRISSLPEVVVDIADNGGCDLLLNNEFLKECVDRFSVPVRGSETNSRSFPPKHLNIVDPLKENNNLGRSVSKGNFFRIRSAFTYGARKLGRILSQAEENVADELRRFFANTLERHGTGQRPDVQDPLPMNGQHGYTGAMFLGTEACQDNQRSSEPEHTEASGINGQGGWDHETNLTNKNTTEASYNSGNGSLISQHRLSGDAKDLATSRIQHLSLLNEVPTGAVKPQDHVPRHLNFAHSAMGNGVVRNGNSELVELRSSNMTQKTKSAVEETTSAVSNCTDENHFNGDHVVRSPVGPSNHSVSFSRSVAFPSEDLCPDQFGSQPSASTHEAVNSLSDLSGDYEGHLHSLRNGRWWYEYPPGSPVPPIHPTIFTPYQSKNSWDGMRRPPSHYRQNGNGVVPRPVFNSINAAPLIRGAMFGVEEVPKPRGTGTYFPNVNHYRDSRPLAPRGRSQVAQPLRSPRSNGRITPPFQEPPKVVDRSNHEMLPLPLHYGPVFGGRLGSSDANHHSTPAVETNNLYSNVNGVITHPAERAVEFGSIHLQVDVSPAAESGGHETLDSAAVAQSPMVGVPSSPAEGNGFSAQSYRLKDEDDFPPLSDTNGKGLPASINSKKPERQESSNC